jgi:membrane-associated phospholipid phosphatase
MSSQSPSSPHARKRHDVTILLLTVVIGLACGWVAYIYLDQAFVDVPKPWVDHPVWDVALTGATWLGNWQLAPILIVVLLFAARSHWRRLLKTMVVAYLLRTAAVEWLKLMTGRPRPRQIPDATVWEGFGAGTSFPSGHASFSFMIAVIISAWFPRWRWPAWMVAVFVSMSRAVTDAHFVSDVMVGAVIGIVAGVVVLWIWPPVTEETEEAIEREHREKQDARERWLASPEGRATRARSRRLALGVLKVVLWIAATLLAYWFIDPIPGFHDNWLFQQEWMQALGRVGRHLGTWDLAPILVAIALIAGRDRWKRLLITILAGYAIQSTLTEVVKDAAGRPRPSQIPDPDLFLGPGTEYHSLPSGHASFIFMFATVCAAWFPRARWPLWILAALVAASRVILGAHYISDVVFGALVGILAGWIVLAIWRPWGKGLQRQSVPERRKRRAAPSETPLGEQTGQQEDSGRRQGSG